MNDDRTTRPSGRRLESAFAGLFASGLLLAVTAPVVLNWADDPPDGFPFSYYPMFSKVRGETVHVNHVVGLDGRMRPHLLRHADVATGGMNQVRRNLNRAVRCGRAFEVCERVAERIATSGKKRHRDLVNVAVVRSTYRLDDFMAGDRQPENVRVVFGLPVERTNR